MIAEMKFRLSMWYSAEYRSALRHGRGRVVVPVVVASFFPDFPFFFFYMFPLLIFSLFLFPSSCASCFLIGCVLCVSLQGWYRGTVFQKRTEF